MTTQVFKKNVLVSIKGVTHEFTRLVDINTWQLTETKTNRVHEFTTDDLNRMYLMNDLQFLKDVKNLVNQGLPP